MFELDTTTAFLYILTGSFAGFSAGLLGIGGGLIIVPVLFYIFSSQSHETQYLMHMALATSLATIITTSISSTLAHHKKRAVVWPLVLRLSPGICAGAWLGATFASHLDSAVLKPVFALFEVFVAGLMVSPYQNKQPANNTSSTDVKTGSLVFGGGIIGALSAMIGIGGGTLTVPFLHWHRIPIKNAIATSAACGLPIAFFATTSYIASSLTLTDSKLLQSTTSIMQTHTLGFVQLDPFFLIALSSFIFAPVGAKTAHHLPSKHLKKIFAILLLLLGFKMLLF